MAYDSMQAIFKGLESYVLSGVTLTDQKLGTGSYAAVFKVDHLGLKCAGKKIHKDLLGQEANFMTYTVQRFNDECRILSQVRHPNIVQFLGLFFQQGEHIPILVMEFLPLNLDQCLDKHSLPNEIKYSILHDVALGLHYLHSQHSPIVHRDLSSNNVLLTSNMTAKISDLGVARILNLSLQKITHLTKAPGTPTFMPPEVMVAEPKYDTSVDIFSYGILMIHVLSGKWPEPQLGQTRIEGGNLVPVSEAQRRDMFLEAIGKRHPLMDLILKCIHNNPEIRANSNEIVNRLVKMVEQHPISFHSRLDMVDHIGKLEEKNEALEKQNKLEMLEQATKIREAISKLERKQKEDQTEVQTLLHTMEKAIDNLKTSTDEIKRVMDFRVLSTSRELDELRQKLKQSETPVVSPQSPAPRQRRSYENYTLPACRQKSDAIKTKLVRAVSDSSSDSVAYDSKMDTKLKGGSQAKEQWAINPQLKSKPRYENVKADTSNASKYTKDDVFTESNECQMDSHSNKAPQARYSSKPTTKERDLKQGRHKSMPDTYEYHHPPAPPKRSNTSESMAESDKSAAVNVGSVSAPKQPRKGQQPPPTSPKTRDNVAISKMSKSECFSKEDIKPKDLAVSTIIEQKEDTSSDMTATKGDPKREKHTHNLVKALFSSKQKEDKEPLLQHSPTDLIKSESSLSAYDLAPLRKATNEPLTINDDLIYPIYTAKFDYEATSPSELSFRKGDQMHIKSKGDGKTWYASLTVGNGKGYIPKSHVTPLDDEEWFFGKMDWNTAKKFIMTSSNQIGSFMVRQNEQTGTFSVTVRDQDKSRHYRILKQKSGMVYIHDKCIFRSLHDLVQHHSQNADGLCTTLSKPCIVPCCITDRSEVTCVEKLATGQFSQVWKGEWKSKAIIVNKITQGTVIGLDLLDKCAFLKSMNHENLVKFFAVHMNSEPYLVITEYMANGSLKEYLPSEGKDLKMAALIKISEHVAAAMQYLEECNCIHQDLSAKNVLIEVEDEETLMIVCKLSIYPYIHKVSEYGAFYRLPAGTIPIRWSSHEAILNNQINIKANVWSFGIIVWEIINYCRCYPYLETSEAGVLEKLKQGFRMPRPLGCPEELYELMCDCWKEDANSRPTFETLHWRLRDFYTADSFGYQYIGFT